MGVVGVTASSLVVEIAQGNEIQWHLILHKVSFYFLLVATFLSAIYQIAIQRHDRELARGFTPKQYEANIRNRVAEDIAKRSQKLIREGNIEQLERETETFKRLYGEGQP
jgi:hypothetical protein